MKSTYLGPRQNYASFKNPILVIDRVGLVGKSLVLKISKEFLVILVSQNNIGLDEKNKNIIHVPFLKKVPKIPDGNYSHVIFIDEKGDDLDLLPAVIKKARNINADFIFAQGLSHKGKYAINRVLNLYHSGKIVLFGDIFDTKPIFRKDFKSTINKFLIQAQRFGRMEIPGEGTGKTYPVFLDDVVDGLIKIIFGEHKSYFLFYIFPNYPTTELSLVHMIQKINPEIKVDFTKSDSRAEDMVIPPRGLYLLEEKYPLAKKIRGVDVKRSLNEREGNSYVPVDAFRKKTLFFSWVLISLLFSPLIFTVLFSFLGKSLFNYAGGEVARGNLVNAQSSLHLSSGFFYLEKQASNVLLSQAKIIKKENKFQDFFESAKLNYELSESISQTFDSAEYLSKILNGKSNNPENDLTKSLSSLRISFVSLEKLRAEKKVSKSILQKIELANPLMGNILSSASALSDATKIEDNITKTELANIEKLLKRIWEVIKLII